MEKKSINDETIKPVKTRYCNECKGEILRMTCKNQINENKKLEANINLLKRQAPNQLGHMLPFYKLKVIRRKVIRYMKNYRNHSDKFNRVKL